VPTAHPDHSSTPQPPRRVRPDVADLAEALTSFVGSVVGLGVGIAVVDGVSAPSLWAIPLAALVVFAITWLLQAPLRWLADRVGAALAFALGLAVQIATMWAALRLLPGLVVRTWWDAALVLLVAAVVVAVLGWLTASDPAYAVGDVVRRGRRAHRRRARQAANGAAGPAAPAREPGLLLVILDGVAEPVLRYAIEAGHAPTMARWLASGRYRLDGWWTQVPATTPASTAGILHGKADHIPAFRWWDASLGRLVVANHPWDAAAIEASFTDGEGLLAHGGAAVATAFSGDAATTQLVMSRTYGHRVKGRRVGSVYIRFLANPFVFFRTLSLTVGEMVKELWQARQARVRGVEPRIGRGGWYVVLRGVTNVWLRALGTTIVAGHMERGTPTIAVDFVDYDEVAHHAGPLRPESMRSLEGLDGVLRALATVNEVALRDYRIVVVSDHGQSLGATFEQVAGRSLTEVVTALMGRPRSERPEEAGHERPGDEDWGPLNALLNEIVAPVRGRTVASGPGRRAAGRPTEPARIDQERLADALDPDAVTVIASGNLGLVWFTGVPGRLQLDEVQRRWPGLVAGLADHVGVGVVVVDSWRGLLVIGPRGVRALEPEVAPDDPEIEGEDPLAIFDDVDAATRDLRRAGRLPSTGDLLVVSSVGPDGHVHAFEHQVGSHGGLGGQQNEALLLHPAALTVSDELVGADAVYHQLVAWQRELGLR